MFTSVVKSSVEEHSTDPPVFKYGENFAVPLCMAFVSVPPSSFDLKTHLFKYGNSKLNLATLRLDVQSTSCVAFHGQCQNLFCRLFVLRPLRRLGKDLLPASLGLCELMKYGQMLFSEREEALVNRPLLRGLDVTISAPETLLYCAHATPPSVVPSGTPVPTHYHQGPGDYYPLIVDPSLQASGTPAGVGPGSQLRPLIGSHVKSYCRGAHAARTNHGSTQR